MKWYKFNVDQFLDDRRHFNDEEELAYRRLVDAYFVTEKPLPLHMVDLLSLTGTSPASTKSVLEKMFVMTKLGWGNSEFDKAIARHQHQRKINQTQGKRGGRPKKSTKP